MRKILLSAILLFTISIFAQQTQNPTKIDWRKMSDNTDATFYEVQKDFKEHWEGKTVTKGAGYKPFKRWEAETAPRVYPSGNMILPHTNYENFMSWQNRPPTNASNAVTPAAAPPASTSGNWTEIGPTGKPSTPAGEAYRTGTGRLNFIRVDPTDTMKIFVGAPDGGVWRSTNGGNSWTTNTDFLGVIGCNDLVIDPTNTQIMYLATGDLEGDRRSIGILKSIDGGNTWGTTSLSWSVQADMKTSRLLMDPNDAQKMIVTTNSGAFYTTDGWDSFSASTFPGSAPDLKDAELKPGTASTVYASSNKVYKSTDFGANWVEITSGLPSASNIVRIALAVSPDDPNMVYAVAGKNSDNSFEGFYSSNNSGTSFTNPYSSATPGYKNLLGYEANGLDLTSGQAFYDLVIAAKPDNADNITISSINQWQSNDGGYSWDIITHWTGDASKPIIHSDFHEITYQPGSNNTLYVGSDGGIWRSRDNGVTWTDLSNNLNIAQINKFGISQSNPDLINAGMQDNGTNFKNALGWNNIFGGDGGESFIDHSDDNTIYFCYTNSEIHRSDDGGVTSAQKTNGLPHGGPSGAEFYSSFHQDPVDASTIYSGGHPDMYKSTDKGENWSLIGTPVGGGNITEFAIAPSNNQVIYACQYNKVSRSNDGGVTWVDASGSYPTDLPLNYAAPVMVAVDKENENKVWVVFSGYSAGDKVFYSKNGGSTWTNISAGLPNLPINTVVSVDNSVGDAIYIGADIGVYYKDSTMSSFIPFFTDLARASVRDLEIQYATGKIRAATYGRGAWESDLYSGTIYDLNISCAGTNNICNAGTNGSATVTISSGNEPYTISWSNSGTTETISNLAAGTYTVTVTDAENNVETCTYIVTEPAEIVANCSGTATSSAGASDGTASVAAATGGTNISTQNAVYTFTGATFNVNGPIETLSTITIPALPVGAVINSTSLNINTFTTQGNSWQSDAYVALSGDYTLAYTRLSTEDNSGTITPNPSINLPSFPITGGTIDLLIQEPTDDPGVDATIAGVDITINYTINGYTYLWSNASTATSLTGLSAGAYTVTISDAIGCTNTCTYTVADPNTNHDIVATTGANGTVTPTGTTSVALNGNQTYTITPASCYQIATVLVDGTNVPAAVTSGSYTFSNVTAAHTISATFTDNTAPVADVATLTNVTAQCSVTSLTAPTATDACTGSVTGTHNATFPITANTTVTWTYTDGTNSSTQTQNVVISDTQAPVADVTTLTTVTGQCSVASITAPTATDACTGSVTGTTTTTFPITASTTVTWTYTDGTNSSTQTQTVTISDTNAPVADVATLTTVTGQCSVASITAPTATDNCAGSVTGTTTTTFPITASTTVTWTYTDGTNTSTQTQTVTISDTNAPVADVATLATITDACSVASITAPTATDACTGSVTGTTTTTFPITASTTVTWTYTDGTNTSTQDQTVTISDTNAPVADVATLTTVTNACSVASITAPTATDNCLGSVTGTTTTTFPISASTTVVWTYTDGANTSTQNQTVTISDTNAPVADVATLATVTDQCSVASIAAPTATDNCAGSVTGTTTTTFPIMASTTVIWTYTDGANTSTQNQTVTINDTNAPVADVATLTDVTAQCSVTSLTAPTATDACTGSVNGTHNATFPITANTSVTWTYTDGTNTSTQMQNVVISDTQAPVADVATLTTITGQCSVASITAPTATDACTGSVTGTTTTTFPITASTTVTWTYTDGTNTSTQDQTVTISDTNAPVADVATLATVTDQCSVASLTAPTATDACIGSVSGTTTSTFPITASTTVTWTYTDGTNTSTQDQTVTISDTNAPVADVTTLTTVTNACSVASITAPTATDNCAGSVTGTTTITFPIMASTTVTWTYTDGTNTSTQDQTVTISDTQAPVADVATLATVTEQCSVVSLTAPTATDNCVGSVTGTTTATFPITASTTVTWTYTDGTNTSTQDQTVTISDTNAPVADLATLATVTEQCQVTDLTAPTATDNCVGSVTGSTTTTFPITESTTVTWTYTDGTNSSTQDQTVTISDTNAPVADVATLTTITEECQVTDLTAPIATDNCVGSVTGSTTTTFPITASTTVTWTYTDGTNTSTQTQDVVITSYDVSVTVSGNTLTANATDVTYQWVDCDNENEAIEGETNQTFIPTSNGNYAVILTKDDCSNTSACTKISTVGITENTFNNEVKIYPNPTNGEVSISFGEEKESIHLVIRNILGQVVLSETYSNSNSIVMNLDVNSGVYYLELSSSEDEKAIIKLIKK